jgi:hypothetical protein
MIRRLYIYWMHRRGKHVLSKDCWCNNAFFAQAYNLSYADVPEVVSYRDG